MPYDYTRDIEFARAIAAIRREPETKRERCPWVTRCEKRIGIELRTGRPLDGNRQAA